LKLSALRYAPLAAWAHALEAAPWGYYCLPQMLKALSIHDKTARQLNYDGLSLWDAVQAGDIGIPSLIASIGNVRDAVYAVRRYGPIVLGAPWDIGFTKPLLSTSTVRMEGRDDGGHAIAIVGYDPNRRRFRFVDNRGVMWGETGRAWISEEDLSTRYNDARRFESYVILPDKPERR
jgi:hypothetical protein